MGDAQSALESVLGRSRAAIVPVLHPGIDESEVTSLLGGVGLMPTAEVAASFGWHNGAGERGMASTVIELVPGGEFYDLGYLCGAYRRAAEPRPFGHGGLLPVMAVNDDLRSIWTSARSPC